MRTAGLSVENLTVRRGGRAILRGLSFDVEAGTALAVTGQNGAGKSSLLRALAGLLPQTDGRVELHPLSDGTSRAAQTHLVAYAEGLKPGLTALQNLRFFAGWMGGAGVSPEAALECVGLDTLRAIPAGFLSSGQRRRVSLARLLVSPRRLWLLDEPTAALDASAEALLDRLMRRHLDGGGLIVAATHAPLAVASRILRLDPA